MFVRKSLRQVVFTLITAALLLTACNMGATPAPTLDVNAINTAAVATAMGQLSAQFTQTALAAPSATPIPSITAVSLATSSGAAPTTAGGIPTISFNSTPAGNITPLAGFTQLVSPVAPASGPTLVQGDSCNNAAYQSDVTFPDGSEVKPGYDFQKVWSVKNTGSCTWDEGYGLIYVGGSSPDLDPYDYIFKQKSDFVEGGAVVNLGINLTTPCTPGKYEGTWRMRSDSGYFFGDYLTVRIEVKEKC